MQILIHPYTITKKALNVIIVRNIAKTCTSCAIMSDLNILILCVDWWVF